ncbi:MAG: glycosyltransferase [Acidimicrobiia bacterium]
MPPDDRAEASGHPSSPRRAGLPVPRFDHLRALTDHAGLWEHAKLLVPRIDHGFCTEDSARALVVVSRQAALTGALEDLAATYLRFVLESRTKAGAFRNRRAADGSWQEDGGSDDSQGRAWWGLGSAARLAPTESMRRAAMDAFATCGLFESPHLRANAYTALGVVEVLVANPAHTGARDLLEETAGVIADAARSAIPWPEDRLTYDNARLPDALLAAGTILGRRRLIADGLRLLEWLVNVETIGDHFSFAPTSGWSIGEPRPGFDQQPVDAWAMADACHRAWVVTGDSVWRVRALRAARWLVGGNDIGISLYDPESGATYDGLHSDSVNENRGAESTLAGIGTLQVAASCEASPRRLAFP